MNIIKTTVISTALLFLFSAFVKADDCLADQSLSSPRFKVKEIKNQGDNIKVVNDLATQKQWMYCPLGLTGVECTAGTLTRYADGIDITSINNGINASQQWRIPNIKELMSIRNMDCKNGLFNVFYHYNYTKAEIAEIESLQRIAKMRKNEDKYYDLLQQHDKLRWAEIKDAEAMKRIEALIAIQKPIFLYWQNQAFMYYRMLKHNKEQTFASSTHGFFLNFSDRIFQPTYNNLNPTLSGEMVRKNDSAEGYVRLVRDLSTLDNNN